jgi:hypothetical protein
MFELGITTVIGRGKFLNITGSLGFTSAAPRLGLAVSLPIRFPVRDDWLAEREGFEPSIRV